LRCDCALDRQVRDFALGYRIKESFDHLGDVGVVHGGPDAGITIGGFFDSDVDVRHIPLQDSLKNIVRQRWEITCKRREGNFGSEFHPALTASRLSPGFPRFLASIPGAQKRGTGGTVSLTIRGMGPGPPAGFRIP